MVTLPLPTVEAVTVREQLPELNVQVAGEGNVTLPVPGVPCVNVTVPVGLEPVTVAVHELVEVVATLEGEQLTELELEAR
jgi:hypothetical protein